MSRNRAKCRLCGEIIESLSFDDMVVCSCEQIAIWGGSYKLNTFAENYENFLRVEDSGEEKAVIYIDKSEAYNNTPQNSEGGRKEKRELALQSLEKLYESRDRLPKGAETEFVRHMDYYSLVGLLLEVFKLS